MIERASERRPEGGFTMIEVMVAILLTALTVIGVLGLYKIETRASSYSRRETEAAVYAQDKFEALRTEAAGSLVSGGDTVYDLLTNTFAYDRTWTVNAVGSIYTIDVTVSWSDDGQPRSLTVHGQRGSS